MSPAIFTPTPSHSEKSQALIYSAWLRNPHSVIHQFCIVFVCEMADFLCGDSTPHLGNHVIDFGEIKRNSLNVTYWVGPFARGRYHCLFNHSFPRHSPEVPQREKSALALGDIVPEHIPYFKSVLEPIALLLKAHLLRHPTVGPLQPFAKTTAW